MVKRLPTKAGDAGDAGLIPWSGRSPGVGNGSPLQFFFAWKSPGIEEPGRLKAHEVERCQTRLSN